MEDALEAQITVDTGGEAEVEVESPVVKCEESNSNSNRQQVVVVLNSAVRMPAMPNAVTPTQLTIFYDGDLFSENSVV
ncbi:hypothetical protein OPV22_026070 [Ensete ventricosum]|uniref:Tify domain-containing protein n=1 Tax=Ensete ventricosum TaxID=4639 RepID=A0AAV8Q9P0_ENSVE|nr:hypothetical protein OPV22_026070 [Ensete ventricosum]